MSEEQTQTCSTCKVVKTNNDFYFRKDINNYRKQCKNCISEQQHKMYVDIKDKIIKHQNDYQRNGRRREENFRLIKNTRTRIHNSLNGKSKSLHTKDLLGIDIETYKRWIEYQMTPEMNFKNIHIDHVKPISSFDISNDNELLEAFNWKNTQPLLTEDNLRKSNKLNELDYQIQFIKAYEFIKSNILCN